MHRIRMRSYAHTLMWSNDAPMMLLPFRHWVRALVSVRMYANTTQTEHRFLMAPMPAAQPTGMAQSYDIPKCSTVYMHMQSCQTKKEFRLSKIELFDISIGIIKKKFRCIRLEPICVFFLFTFVLFGMMSNCQ